MAAHGRRVIGRAESKSECSLVPASVCHSGRGGAAPAVQTRQRAPGSDGTQPTIDPHHTTPAHTRPEIGVLTSCMMRAKVPRNHSRMEASVRFPPRKPRQ
eukprot:5703847-Pleurochrysis_carterae.AAC.1